MNPEERWQYAIGAALQIAPALHRAFKLEGGVARPQPDVFEQRFSSTEAMLVGLLMELWRRAHGLDVSFIPSAKNVRGGVGAGEYFWKGASGAADLFDRLDDRQLAVVAALLPKNVAPPAEDARELRDQRDLAHQMRQEALTVIGILVSRAGGTVSITDGDRATYAGSHLVTTQHLGLTNLSVKPS
jgi:hypothetical protein